MKREKFILNRSNFSVSEFLNNIDSFDGGNLGWQHPKFKYLIDEPMSGWEKVAEQGGVIPDKPEDVDLIPFIDFNIEDSRGGAMSEKGIETLNFVKKALEDSSLDFFTGDLVQALYDIDELEKILKVQDTYISAKNKAVGFAKDVALFALNRVREIINSKQ